MDLAHAHKVFCSVPFMVTCCYCSEFVRVVRVGGWVVFDIMTEECLSPTALNSWASSRIRNGSFPAAMPVVVAKDYFESHGFSFIATKSIDMPPGKTTVLVFRRDAAARCQE